MLNEEQLAIQLLSVTSLKTDAVYHSMSRSESTSTPFSTATLQCEETPPRGTPYTWPVDLVQVTGTLLSEINAGQLLESKRTFLKPLEYGYVLL